MRSKGRKDQSTDRSSAIPQLERSDSQIGQKLTRCLSCPETEINTFKTATFDAKLCVILCKVGKGKRGTGRVVAAKDCSALDTCLTGNWSGTDWSLPL